MGTLVSSANKTDGHDILYINWNIVESGVKHHNTLTHLKIELMAGGLIYMYFPRMTVVRHVIFSLMDINQYSV